ncbi:hypothetical protein Gotur_024877, partial [Gossypium turneri]
MKNSSYDLKLMRHREKQSKAESTTNSSSSF